MLKEGWTVKNAAKRPISKEHPKIFCSEVTGIFYKKSFRSRQVRGAEAHQQWITVHPFQSLSCVWLFATPWTAAHQASLSTTSYWSLLKLICIESAMTSNHLILYRPLLFLPLIFSTIYVFSNKSVLCIRWPKYWSFSISPSNEYSGLISFRVDWFDLLAVQGTLKSLLQLQGRYQVKKERRMLM